MQTYSLTEKKSIIAAMKNSRYVRSDNFTNFIYLFLDYLLIALSIALSIYYGNFFVYSLAILIISSRMRALENLLHEASHRKLFKNRRLNDIAGMILCAFPVFNSFYAYRISHGQHHQHLGDIQLDPDHIRYEALKIESALSNPKAFMKKIARIIFLIDMPKFILGTIQPFMFNHETPKHEVIARAIFYFVLFSLLTYFTIWKYFILYWIVPYFSVFQMIRFLSEITEHGKLYQNTHSVYKMSRNNICHPIVAFFLYPHVDNLHLLHHLLPNVPHYVAYRLHNDLMSDPLYAKKGKHCYGYFLKRHAERPTTISDLLFNEN